MEWYLNAVYFGEGRFGVQPRRRPISARRRVGAVACRVRLDRRHHESAHVRPFYNRQNNKERQETILREMYEHGAISTIPSAVSGRG